MPSLHTILDFAVAQGYVSPESRVCLEHDLRAQWPTERVYIPPPTSNRDRSAEIRKTAARLPVAVVAERYGVSRSWVYELLKRR